MYPSPSRSTTRNSTIKEWYSRSFVRLQQRPLSRRIGANIAFRLATISFRKCLIPVALLKLSPPNVGGGGGAGPGAVPLAGGSLSIRAVGGGERVPAHRRNVKISPDQPRSWEKLQMCLLIKKGRFFFHFLVFAQVQCSDRRVTLNEKDSGRKGMNAEKNNRALVSSYLTEPTLYYRKLS